MARGLTGGAHAHPGAAAPALFQPGPMQGQPLQAGTVDRMDAAVACHSSAVASGTTCTLMSSPSSVRPKSAGTCRLGPADEHLAGLGTAAGAREIGAGRDQVQEIEACLLDGFAPCHLGRVLAGLDDAATGSTSQGSSSTPTAPTELLDENDLAALGDRTAAPPQHGRARTPRGSVPAHATSKEAGDAGGSGRS